MKLARLNAILISGTLVLGLPATARAVTCTATGYLRVASSDRYFCSSDQMGCNGWVDYDLDKIQKPLAHMFVQVLDTQYNTLNLGVTDDYGAFAISFTLPGTQCTGNTVYIKNWYARMDNLNITMKMVAQIFGGEVITSELYPVTLTGSSTNAGYTYPATDTNGFAAVYYTANSARSTSLTWNTTLASRLTAQPLVIEYAPWTTSNAATIANFRFVVSYDVRKNGFNIRHEYGHLIAGKMLNAQQGTLGGCRTYLLGNSNGHGWRSCEFGYPAMDEALANFLGVSTITGSNNAFACAHMDDNDPQTCSKQANTALTRPDRFYDVGNGATAGIGDTFMGESTECMRLVPSEGCNCAVDPSTSLCVSSFNQVNGWRNEIQVTRYLWDVVDNLYPQESWDGAGYGLNTFAANMMGIPCTGNSSEYGVDGTCNEPNRVNGGSACVNADETTIPAVQQGSRDSFNVADLVQIFPNSLYAAIGNCGYGAQD